MLYRLRRKDGSAGAFSKGALILPDGARIALSVREFALKPRRWWTSPTTRRALPGRVVHRDSRDSAVAGNRAAPRRSGARPVGPLLGGRRACGRVASAPRRSPAGDTWNWRATELRGCPTDKRKTPRRFRRGVLFRILAVTYSRLAYGQTTIGAERFHFRVRNGIGWFPPAMTARKTVARAARSPPRRPVRNVEKHIDVSHSRSSSSLGVIWSSLTGN